MNFRTPRLWAFTGLLAAGLLFAAACGGDSKSSGGGPGGGGGTGSDESYVAALCKAELKFADSFNKAMSGDPSKLTDPNEVAKMFTGPFDQLAKDMKAANPPKDVKEYHDQLVKAISDASTQLKNNKDISQLDFGSNIKEPPQDVSDRLQKIADKNEDCKKADFSFTQ